MLCSICGDDTAVSFEDLEIFEHRGVVKELPSYFSECDQCGLFATQLQINKNAAITRKFREDVNKMFLRYANVIF
jgi:uncharacterized Zn finger protein